MIVCFSDSHRNGSAAVDPWRCSRCQRTFCAACEGPGGGVDSDLCDACWTAFVDGDDSPETTKRQKRLYQRAKRLRPMKKP